MRYYILESGSKGNSTLIKTEKGIIVIDNGIKSKKKFLSKLSELSISLDDIKAVLVTHGHSDHIDGLSIFKPNIIYATNDTFSCIKNSFKIDGSIFDENHYLDYYQEIKINDLKITVLPTSHDKKGSIGFKIEEDNEILVYITDTGFIYEKALEMCKNATYYILESNHDVEMLLNTNRPQKLKERILGDKGHLSNEDCSLYLAELIGNNTKEIIFAHISQEANNKEKVINTFLKIMEKRLINLEGILFRCSSQTDTISGGKIIKEEIKNA